MDKTAVRIGEKNEYTTRRYDRGRKEGTREERRGKCEKKSGRNQNEEEKWEEERGCLGSHAGQVELWAARQV